METFEDRGTRRRAARARRKAAVRPKSTRGARALAFIASLGLMAPTPLEAMHSRGTIGIPSIVRVGGSLLYDRSHNTTITSTTVDDSDPVMTLDALTYTCVVTNTGGAPLVGLSLAFTIDTHSTYVSASAGTFTSISQSGGVVTATLSSSLAAGGTATCTITVTTPATAQTLTATSSATATNATTQNDSETTDVQLVAKDGTSGIRCPASAAQWTSVRACKSVVGTPSLLWLCQEASGNLADSIGTFTSTNFVTPVYQSTESGWTRKGISSEAGGTVYNVSSSLPDNTTDSSLLLLYADMFGAAPSSDAAFATVGNFDGGYLWRRNTTDKARANFRATSAVTSATQNGQVRPFVLQTNRANSSQYAFTDAEKLSPTWNSAINGKQVTLGTLSGTAGNIRCLYLTEFFTTNAEISNAQIKAMLQALGWTIAWT